RSSRCATASPRSPPWSPTARVSRCSRRPARSRSPRSRTSSARSRTWTWTRSARRTPRRRSSRSSRADRRAVSVRTGGPLPRTAPPPPGSGDGGAPRAWAGRSVLVATERATLPVEAAAAVIAPERPVPVPARALAAARPAIEADAQLAAADLRARDPPQPLRGQRAPDLDQGEVREDLDLADVVAVQTALAGQGADDPRGPCTVGVAHPDLVRRVAALGGRCVAARAALPAPVVTGELRTGELLLLGGGTGTVVTHRHRTEGGGQLQRIQVVLGDELTDQLAVEVQASALDALGQLGQLRDRKSTRLNSS